MTAREKLALKRLTQWSDPKASGDPTARMRSTWSSPMDLAKDIHVLLELVKDKANAQ